MKRKYERGVYRLVEPWPESESEVIWYDGEYWWAPGWECAMSIGPIDGAFTITEDMICELIAAYD